MASLITRVILGPPQYTRTKLANFCVPYRWGHQIGKKPKRGTIKHRNLIASSCEKLAARGFLRFQKSYSPASNVVEKVTAICKNVLGNEYQLHDQLSPTDKFSLLNNCFQELSHSVPNSLLHQIETVNDVLEFYQTPVVTTTPYDELQNIELPPNLQIQYEYVRFNPETDTKFNGVTAFPESSTIVTDIKYKGKYKGVNQRSPFYYDNWADFIKK